MRVRVDRFGQHIDKEFPEKVKGDDAYEIHTNLLRHGRRICTARAPLCEECPLLDLCPYGQALLTQPSERGQTPT